MSIGVERQSIKYFSLIRCECLLSGVPLCKELEEGEIYLMKILSLRLSICY
jgi:hypothetical protein